MKASSWFQLIQNCKGLKFSTFYTVYVSHNKQLSRYFLMFFVTSHHWITQSHQLVWIMPQGLCWPYMTCMPWSRLNWLFREMCFFISKKCSTRYRISTANLEGSFPPNKVDLWALVKIQEHCEFYKVILKY